MEIVPRKDHDSKKDNDTGLNARTVSMDAENLFFFYREYPKK